MCVNIQAAVAFVSALLQMLLILQFVCLFFFFMETWIVAPRVRISDLFCLTLSMPPTAKYNTQELTWEQCQEAVC